MALRGARPVTLGDWLAFAEKLYAREKLALGQVATNAHDEALYLLLTVLRLPLDSAAREVQMPQSTLNGDANLLVCPNIDAANISYNLLKTAAGGNIAIGPVLLGAAKPVHILTASTTVRRIVNMTALTVADANAAR